MGELQPGASRIAPARRAAPAPEPMTDDADREPALRSAPRPGARRLSVHAADVGALRSPSCWRRSILTVDPELRLLRPDDGLALGRLRQFHALLHRPALAADLLEHAALRALRGHLQRRGRPAAGAGAQPRDAGLAALLLPARLLPAGDHRRRLRLDRLELFLRRRPRRHQLLPAAGRPARRALADRRRQRP